MKRFKLLALLMSVFLVLSLAACAAAPNEMGGVAMDGMYAPEKDFVANEAVTESPSLSGNAGAGVSVQTNQKLIQTVRITAETDNMDGLLGSVNEKIAALQGYVEAQEIYNGGSTSRYRYRYANLTLRIPAAQLDQFVTQIGDISNIVSTNKSTENITLSYVATQSRITALEVEQARLLELLAQAQDMQDLLTVEARLTEVRTELENVASQLRLYDNLVDYATVHLNITEVTEYTEPVEEPTTLWQELWQGLKDSAEGLVETLEDLLVFFAENFFGLLIFLVLPLVALVILLRALRKKRRKAAQKKEEQA